MHEVQTSCQRVDHVLQSPVHNSPAASEGHSVATPPSFIIPNSVPESSVGDAAVQNTRLCSTPVLDLNGMCHCPAYQPVHVPVTIPKPGRSFPPCRDPCLRLLYIDDALLATTVHVDRECASLLPTEGPYGRLWSCGLGIPGG